MGIKKKVKKTIVNQIKAFKAQMPAEKMGDADLLTRISPESIKYHFFGTRSISSLRFYLESFADFNYAKAIC